MEGRQATTNQPKTSFFNVDSPSWKPDSPQNPTNIRPRPFTQRNVGQLAPSLTLSQAFGANTGVGGGGSSSYSSVQERNELQKEIRLTEKGVESDFKNYVLNRYTHLKSRGQIPAPDYQTPEAILLTDQVITPASESHRQPLASLQPFSAEELGAVATGQYVQVNPPKRPIYNTGSGTRHNENSYAAHGDEEEEILWGDESVKLETVGSFDSNGQFVTTKSVQVAAELPPPQSVPSTLPSMPPGLGPALPIIYQNTAWIYRDPTGVLQGPFPNSKMLEWYQMSYFPDSLPIKRQEDSFFETIAGWRLRCNGRLPFEIARPVEDKTQNETVAKLSSESKTSREFKTASSLPPQKTRDASEWDTTGAKASPTSTLSALKQPGLWEYKPSEVKKPSKEEEERRFLAGLMNKKMENLSLGNESSARAADNSNLVARKLTVEQLEAQVDAATGKQSQSGDGWKVAGQAPKSTIPTLSNNPQASNAPKQSVVAIQPVIAKQHVPIKQLAATTETLAQTQSWLTSLFSVVPGMDAQTCVLLLMELTTVQDVIGFCRDNQLLLPSGLTPLRFAQDLIGRRFGAEIAAKQAKSCAGKLSSVDNRDLLRECETGDFVTVTSKRSAGGK